MEQRSEEWFAARRGVITGSRVGGILGVNPYQKSEDVLRAMVREAIGQSTEFTGNAATSHGERMEPVALDFYQRATGNTVDQTGFVKHEQYDFIGVSPDGLVGIDGGIEIKCPYWAKQPYSVHDKPSYYAQCQLIMETCELEWMDFVRYIDDQNNLIERIYRDEEWFVSALPKLTSFHKKYSDIVGNEALWADFMDRTVDVVETTDSIRLEELYLQIVALDTQLKPLKEQFDALKKELGAQYGTFRTGSVKVTRIEKKGSVDNKTLYKDLGVDDLLKARGKTIDDYRGEPVVSYNISLAEEE